jgi:hypothetical protein
MFLVIWNLIQFGISSRFTDQDISKLYTGNYTVFSYHFESSLALWEGINTNYSKIEIQSKETEILSILEIRSFPCIKIIEDGKVYTFDHELSAQRIERFLQNYKKSRYYNYLPMNFTIWSKLQLDLYLYMKEYQERLAQSFGRSIIHSLDQLGISFDVSRLLNLFTNKDEL